MADRTCRGCAEPLPEQGARERNPRQWCSETCRTRTYYLAAKARLGHRPGHFPRCAVFFPTCIECGTIFCAQTSRGHVCSVACNRAKKRRAAREHFLANREAVLERHKVRRANASLEDRMKNQARNQARRAIVYAADAEVFSPLEIYERDLWTCGLCGDSIDPELRFPDRWSASLDHIVPLSLGGKHTRANSRASHLSCNASRGNRGNSQSGGISDGWTRPRTEGQACA